MNGSFVSAATRERVRDLATPIARGLGRLGLSPNALTLIGFVGTCLAAFAAASEQWFVAGVLVVAFGIFDLFDGILARVSGRATKLGAFLDSTFDRAGEAIVYIGIAGGCLAVGFDVGAILAASAMAAAFMVSYTRAKAESLGFATGSGFADIGFAPREVRLGILAFGLVLAPRPLVAPLPSGVICGDFLCEGFPGGLLTIALAAIVILATITVIQRILHARAQSREG